MLHLLGKIFPPHGARITCVWDGEGAGSQVHSRLSTRIFAARNRLKYVHSPLRNVARVEPGWDVQTWSQQWEQFFNLGYNSECLPCLPSDVNWVEKPHRTFYRPGRLYAVKHCHRISNRHPEAFAALADWFRACYYSTPKPELPDLSRAALNISVHLRRGEITKGGCFGDRFIEADLAAERVIRALNEWSTTDRRPRVLHVHSEGKPEDFEPFLKLGASLHLNDDAFTTFHRLVSADVLFTTKSSFSYLAAILSKGTCFYEPFWHPRLPDWREMPRN